MIYISIHNDNILLFYLKEQASVGDIVFKI